MPPLSDPALAGLMVQHAAVVYDLAPLALLYVSNPVDLQLVP